MIDEFVTSLFISLAISLTIASSLRIMFMSNNENVENVIFKIRILLLPWFTLTILPAVFIYLIFLFNSSPMDTDVSEHTWLLLIPGFISIIHYCIYVILKINLIQLDLIDIS